MITTEPEHPVAVNIVVKQPNHQDKFYRQTSDTSMTEHLHMEQLFEGLAEIPTQDGKSVRSHNELKKVRLRRSSEFSSS